ncbi:hypothetical protein FGO68_gene6029 [Halteria grandinella]|uniref:Replication protein A C-terminal domain-containing protein n=1 Tax=Halteria grandinella TaxID=5974 RepID=A0A8J8NS46_HALGN|nr:hypothetical protein FGO68_gene6029 [Halteria grandinella]
MLRIGFEVNDNTGCCPVIFFQKDQSSRPQALKDFQYEQFAYVRIFGTVRVFKETKAIVGTHIKRIHKFSEVTNHLLQTFVSHQVRTQGALTSQELNNEDPAKGKRTSNPVTLGVKQSSSVDDSMQTVVQIMREMVKRSDVRMLHIKDVYAVVSHVQEWELFKETIDRLLREGVIVQQSEQNSDIILLSE